MVIAEDIKKKISDTPDGVVLTIGDFNVDMQYQGALNGLNSESTGKSAIF